MTTATGTVSDTSGTSVGAGAAQWANPSNIYTSNNTYAVAASSGGTSTASTTGYIYALGNGFSIPSGATINGLKVNIEAKNELSGTGFRIRSASSDIFLRHSSSDISTNSPTGAVSTETWTGTTDSTKTFGSSAASWGASLTPAIVNDSSFGVRLRAQNVNGTTQRFSIDSISITVYYTDSGISSSQQFFARRF